ncbi:hypothetical protein MRB53_040458 [Persea americana]|nr:hypothetical protein MRB53_040458 [Persea americana]
MPQGEQPLLARSPSEAANDRDVEEEDALLTGQKQFGGKGWSWKSYREAGLAVWAILATAFVVILAVLYQQSRQADSTTASPSGKRNLIFMVSDGMGPTSLSLTRSFKQYRDGLPWTEALLIDQYVIGQSRTRSTSSLVTDSAAGATAFSCGAKSYNGAIAVLPDHSPCGTVMEAAKKAGYMTGLVVTTRLTDATPACFAAHVNKREEEDRIAEQLLGQYPLGQVVDLMLGAGRCHFLPNTTSGSCRADDKDLVKMAKKNGMQYVDSREGFDGLKIGSAVELPVLGLFADEDIPYEIDRRHEDDVYPSLKEMTETALKALSDATKNNDKGFFLMVEGSRIDHAGHANDPAAQVYEVLAYDAAMAAVIEFLEKDTIPGVMISTSDHETGGLSTAKQLHSYAYPTYGWYPSVLANVSQSVEWVTREFHNHLDSTRSENAEKAKRDALSWIYRALPKYLGVEDASDEEILTVFDHPEFALWTFADIISRRAQSGWSTHGHSAADVNIYASDHKVAKALIGSHENTEVGDFLRTYLDVDTEAVTKELQEKGVMWDEEDDQGNKIAGSWLGAAVVGGERLDGQDHLDHYTGDHKHKRCSVCGV